jgi:predicted CoA-binding protein
VGIRNDRFAAEITEAGIDLVQGRCTLAAHRAWG